MISFKLHPGAIMKTTGLLCLLTSPVCIASAQERSVIYDTLSFVEEPLAVEIGDVTFSLRGTVDVPFTVDLKNTKNNSFNLRTAFQVGAETQLENALRLGAFYGGELDVDDGFKGYKDKISAFVGSPRGTLYGGNVSDVLQMQTRRKPGVGNANLSYDGNLGQLNELSIAYLGMFGPTQIGGTVDKDGRFEIGMLFQRPLADKDHRYSVRFTDSEYTVPSGLVTLKSRGIIGVAELIYGSTNLSIGAGAERLSNSTISADRWFLTGGTKTKIGAYSLSAEAHYGQIEGQQEMSAALGASYDFARGASIDLGLNHKNAQSDVDGIQILDDKSTEGILSLRYSF